VDGDAPRERFVRVAQDLRDHTFVATVTQPGSQRMTEDVRRYPRHRGSLGGGTESATHIVIVLVRAGEEKEQTREQTGAFAGATWGREDQPLAVTTLASLPRRST
jgi:hypothetical protein